MRNQILILLFWSLFANVLNAQPTAEGGIGIKLRQEVTGDFVISEVFMGGPADKAGIFVGEMIRGVNDINISRNTLEQVVAMIRGPVGSEVTLTLQHQSYPNLRNIKVKRYVMPHNPTLSELVY